MYNISELILKNKIGKAFKDMLTDLGFCIILLILQYVIFIFSILIITITI